MALNLTQNISTEGVNGITVVAVADDLTRQLTEQIYLQEYAAYMQSLDPNRGFEIR